MRNRRSLLSLLAAGILALATSAYAQAPSAQALSAQAPLLIRGAAIIDGLADAPLRDRSLLIEGNTIRGLLPADAPAPAGAQVLDLTGKFIIPGLFDSHVHWDPFMGELLVNHGVTSILALDNVPKALRTRSQAAHDLPRLHHTGARPQFNPNSSEADISRTLRTWLASEPDMAWFPQYNTRLSRAYKFAADEAHKAGYLVFSHADDAPGAMRDGIDILEHVWGFGEAQMTPEQLKEFQEGKLLTWAVHLNDWTRNDAWIAEAVRRGVYMNPTMNYEWGGMSRRSAQRELEDYRTLSNPDLVYFPRNMAESILARNRQIKNYSSRYDSMPWVPKLPAADRAEFEAGFKNVLEFNRRWVAAGGKIQAGTDIITGGIPGLALHHEMEILVESGLTPMQAIKAASSWSAEILEGRNKARGDAKIGSIRAGNFADLVVVSADPTADISNTKKIERVMKDGRWVAPGYHPEYYTFTTRPRSLAATTFAPAIASVTPASVTEGSGPVRVVLEGSGFMMTSLVRVDGVSVKTIFRGPRQIEFEMPASAIERATPNPYFAPGPVQSNGFMGYRAVSIHVFNPPPEGGTSNTISQMVMPK
ncbi:MAG TPA: amidohydrolase family protein [Xanthobacteraceae bacterium]|nr:amidohydrolase family protein [Xanthobacteraceae bacterium]